MGGPAQSAEKSCPPRQVPLHQLQPSRYKFLVACWSHPHRDGPVVLNGALHGRGLGHSALWLWRRRRAARDESPLHVDGVAHRPPEVTMRAEGGERHHAVRYHLVRQTSVRALAHRRASPLSIYLLLLAPESPPSIGHTAVVSALCLSCRARALPSVQQLKLPSRLREHGPILLV